ncbi:MAG: signal peptide peptidase SppA [Lewinella sp.]|nr:signal peptide peptidase SppA [Lewinella sp.]
MRQFFKFLFASCLGTIIALLVIAFVGTGLFSALARQTNQAPPISANSVLHLKLNQLIPELADNYEPSTIELNQPTVLGLKDILDAIATAKHDPDIKGIFMETDVVMSSFSNTIEIRKALLDFKASGKFITAHAPYYSQGAYYLASAADRVTVAPLGLVDFRGFSAQIPFFRDLLSSVGVKMEVFDAGKFKSATEPYWRMDMSPESRLQTRVFLDGMYQIMLDDLAASRGLSQAQLRELADTYAGIDAEQALEGGLVDGVVYREAVLEDMRDQLGLDTDSKVKLVELNNYYQSRVTGSGYHSDKIALVIAEGTIVDGKGDPGQTGDLKYVKLIEDIRKNDHIKAVVLRVNSPGGSGAASDHIWQALTNLQETGKPVIVSMGDYAASGGYYISCGADMIYAQPSTLTGSIGVFSVFPNMEGLLEDHLNIFIDTVQTGPMAAGLTPFRELSPTQKALLQNRTDHLYDIFLQRVSDGRGLTKAEVDSIAQGRVWLGQDAIDIGLVDKLGGLDDAIAEAAERAGLSEYQLVTYPEPVDPLTRLLNELLNQEEVITRTMIQHRLGAGYESYRLLQEILQSEGPQMRMPFVVPFE